MQILLISDTQGPVHVHKISNALYGSILKSINSKNPDITIYVKLISNPRLPLLNDYLWAMKWIKTLSLYFILWQNYFRQSAWLRTRMIWSQNIA